MENPELLFSAPELVVVGQDAVLAFEGIDNGVDAAIGNAGSVGNLAQGAAPVQDGVNDASCVSAPFLFLRHDTPLSVYPALAGSHRLQKSAESVKYARQSQAPVPLASRRSETLSNINAIGIPACQAITQ